MHLLVKPLEESVYLFDICRRLQLGPEATNLVVRFWKENSQGMKVAEIIPCLREMGYEL